MKKTGITLPSNAAQLSRRELLSAGASFTGWASLGTLFPELAPLVQAQSFTVQKRLVWVNLSGGWDILEATDPQTGSTSGIQMVYNWDQANTVSGTDIKIGRWLPNISGIGSDLVVVRGLAMGTTAHDAGNIYMDTGVLSNAGNVNAASIPAIVASESGATIPIIQLDGGNEPLTDRGLLNPVSVVRANNLPLYQSLYPTTDTEKQLRLRILEYVNDSVSRLQAKVGVNDRLTSIGTARGKIVDQINSDVGSKLGLTDADRAPFITGGPTGLNSNFADSAALAAKLLKNNLVDSICLGVGGFDTHANQDAALEPTMRSVDFVVRKLYDELKNAGQIDNTLIVLYSDFGRTPRVNGRNGRDHWPVGGAMMIGGGIDGGRAVGGIDSNMLALSTNTTTGATDSGGEQLNPTHLGGSVLSLCLGTSYMQYRSYLTEISALTRTK